MSADEGRLFLRLAAPPPPRSMTLEWQEATNEQLKEMNVSWRALLAAHLLELEPDARSTAPRTDQPHLRHLFRGLQVRPSYQPMALRHSPTDPLSLPSTQGPRHDPVNALRTFAARATSWRNGRRNLVLGGGGEGKGSEGGRQRAAGRRARQSRGFLYIRGPFPPHAASRRLSP